MKNLSFFLIVVCCYVFNLSAQNSLNMQQDLDTPAPAVLAAEIQFVDYPLISDIYLNRFKQIQPNLLIKYPVLIVNNIVTRDSIQVDYFRNNYSQDIKKIKRLHYEEAVKKGFKNIPRDGAVLVTMKKNIYIDLYK